METKKTELIKEIIKQHSPNLYKAENGIYTNKAVIQIAHMVWDTANSELDKIYELKANEVLEQRIEDLEKKSKKARNLFEDILIINDGQIQNLYSQIENLKRQNEELHTMYSDSITTCKNLKTENKELIEELESNKLHLQDTYEEMQRTNQAEYERGLENGWNNCVDADNNEH